jgi:hypothetical protein
LRVCGRMPVSPLNSNAQTQIPNGQIPNGQSRFNMG